MRQHRPEGPAPTTLERNVLRLRAFEMVLVLFYMEDLKAYIVQSIQITDKLNGKNRLQDGKPNKQGKKLELARNVLVAEGVITDAESEELHRLINYRNTIGHEIHDMTVAVGAYTHLSMDRTSLEPIDAYDYRAVARAAALREKIVNGMGRKFILAISLDPLKFEAAEKTYLVEIKRLKAKVNKGIHKLNELINDTNGSMKAIPKSVLESAQPGHPHNQKQNGHLTDKGKSCIYQLYEAKATPLAAAYMMRISLRTANLWFKRWMASK